jgi:hypothetical protein
MVQRTRLDMAAKRIQRLKAGVKIETVTTETSDLRRCAAFVVVARHGPFNLQIDRMGFLSPSMSGKIARRSIATLLSFMMKLTTTAKLHGLSSHQGFFRIACA